MIPDAVTLDAASGIADHRGMRPTQWLAFASLTGALVFIGACKGDTGPEGPQGPPGEPGEPGEPAGGIEREIFGLVGQILEPNGTLVPGGTVYLVPAADVEALAPIDLLTLFASPQETEALDNDEPIEDLVDLNGDSYEQAPVDAEGSYRFETLPDGSHFVAWFPAADDEWHLPGGDYSRVAFATESLIGMRMDIRVSSQPSSAAIYVGSSTCMVCHGLHSTTRTAHNVGLQVPGVRSILQDIEPWPDFDEALAEFDAGTTLFYYDCDGAVLGPAKCKIADPDQPPPANVSFQINLERDLSKPLGAIGAYYVEMVEGVNTERYDVVLTYGGALGKQQYLTRRENGSVSYFVLPLQYNYQGDFANPDPDDWPWRDYRSDQWFNFTSGLLTEPPNQESFDNNCAGCHFTGYELRGDEASGWSAHAVVDPDGAFDYDGDGRVELINVGCESCHGPGSEHLELSPRASYIVSPGLLTPGRASAICGSCHSRPLGIGAGTTGLPLSADNQMPPAGIRRMDFALDYTTRVSGAPEDFFSSGDAAAHYQQYSGHLQSRHYRNPTRIATCTGCHNPHANFEDVYGPAVSENLNPVCTVCHSAEEFLTVLEHVQRVTGFGHDGITREFRCTECHMVPTAKSGASVPALLDTIPGGDPTVQYYWNDIAAHRMIVTGREAVLEQPIAATNQCAPCHGGFFPNQ